MLELEINGKKVSVEAGTNLIEAAQKSGTYIPHFCYHKKLSIAANCRMCLVQSDKVPKPIPACATLVADGMKVLTDSDMASDARKGVMEFLLINHPLDCPVCDKGGECQLQDLSVGYGSDKSRFTESKRVVVSKYLGPLVSAEEMSRCIHCTRCIRFTEEIAGIQEIGMVGRGGHSEILAFMDRVVKTEVSGNVIDLCPVGALTSRPFRFSARSWELSRRKSVSPHDSLGSNLIVQVKNRVVKRVLPLENEEINECWLSDRDRFSYEGLNHPDRLKNPKIKYGNKWHDVDWQTAFKYILKAINGVAAEHGKDEIGIWANQGCTLEELYLIKKFATSFGIDNLDSRLRRQDYKIDYIRTGALWLGQKIKDLSSNQAILIIGSNLRTEQPLLTTRIRKIAANGCKVSIVNFYKEDLYIKLFEQLLISPVNFTYKIKELIEGKSDDKYLQEHFNNILNTLRDNENTSIILGAEIINHPNFTNLYLLFQELAKNTNSKLGILPEYANSIASQILDINPKDENHGIKEMINNPKKAMLLFNIEPEIDLYHNRKSLLSLKEAETVIAFSSYESKALLDFADILLPISPFTETSGSFINLEGRLQSFYGVTRALGETRPLWKILRVLGNIFSLPGFEYNSSEEILLEFNNNYNLQELLNNKVDGDLTIKDEKDSSLIRIGGITLYATDAVVRRAESLQKTLQAKIPIAKVNPKTFELLGEIEPGDEIDLEQDNGQKIRVKINVDDKVALGALHLPLHQSNKFLGAMFNSIKIIKRG